MKIFSYAKSYATHVGMVCSILAICLNFSARSAENLSLEKALNLALSGHPALIQQDAQFNLRVSEARAVTILPDPELEVELEKLTATPAVRVKLTQPLQRSYFGLRRGYAAAMKATAQTVKQAVLVAALNETVSAYYSVSLLKERKEAIDVCVEDITKIKNLLAKSIESGQAGQSDAEVFEAELAKYRVASAELDGRLGKACEILAEKVGKPGKSFSTQSVRLVTLPAKSSKLASFAARRSSLRKALLAQQAEAFVALQVAQKDRVGTIKPMLLGSYDHETNESALGVGVILDWPFWSKNKPAIEQAQARVVSLQRQLKQMRPEDLNRIVQQRLETARAAELAAKIQETQVVPAYQRALTHASERLKAGQTDVLFVWQLQKELAQARMGFFDLQANAIESRARLEEIIGGRIEEALGDR